MASKVVFGPRLGSMILDVFFNFHDLSQDFGGFYGEG